MIVFCGVPSERPLQAAIAAAERRGVDYALVSQREAAHIDLMFQGSRAEVVGELRLAGRIVKTGDVRGVYLRMMDPEDLPEVPGARAAGDPRSLARARLVHAALNEWLDLADCRVLNRPAAMLSNASKPYQALFIRRHGFAIPETLLTTNPDAARRFAARHQRVIYKSISSVRSVVQELTPQRLADVDLIRHLPTQFQALIPGPNIRVHVIGDRCLATELRSDAVDYRYASRAGATVSARPVTLPEAIARRCLALAMDLELSFAGIDLKRWRGRYYCLEVNPAPAYTYYQDLTGQPIAEALVGYLIDSRGTRWSRSRKTGQR